MVAASEFWVTVGGSAGCCATVGRPLFLMSAGPRWLENWAKRYEPDQADWWRRLFDHIGKAVGDYVGGVLAQATVAGVSPTSCC